MLLQMLGLDTQAKVTRIKAEEFMELFHKVHKPKSAADHKSIQDKGKCGRIGTAYDPFI